jgi:excinuclease UvrABC ATPase subunit
VAIQDHNSNSLNGTIHQILDYLQQVYRRVSPQMLENHKQELKNLVYNPKYPINTVFNAVDNVVDFAELGHQPLTQCS